MGSGDIIVNSAPEGLLRKYRKGEKEGALFLKLESGFLRLEYTENGDLLLLSRVSFTASGSVHSPAIGNVLECRLTPDEENEAVTFIGEMNVSGEEWSNGEVYTGHTFDDDSPSSAGRKTALEPWFDLCVKKMINPSPKILSNIKKGYSLKNDIDSIKNGSSSARERLWQKCSPSSEEEAGLLLELLDFAIENDDGDLLFSCCDPLKRASAAERDILEKVTSLLEKGLPENDYDRSEMQEIIAAHGEHGDSGLAERWVKLCEISIAEKGVEALHAINEGSLFSAVASVKPRSEGMAAFFKKTVSLVENTPESERDGVDNLHVYTVLKKSVPGG